MSEKMRDDKVINLLTGDTTEPDYFKIVGLLKKSLLDIAQRTKGNTAKDDLRRLMIEKAAKLGNALDDCTARLLATYHAFFLAYLKLTEGIYSDDETQAILRSLASMPQQLEGIKTSVEGVGKAAEEAAEGVRGVPRMCENYRQAVEEPMEMAKNMYRIVWGQMDSRTADIAKFLDDNGWSQRKAARHFHMSTNTIADIVNSKIRPLYEQAGLPIPDPRKRSSKPGYRFDQHRQEIWEDKPK